MPGIVFLVIRLLMATALFAFLVVVILTLWRDLRQHANAVTARRIPAVHLQSDDPLAVDYTFRHSQITLGRNPTCDVHLDDETVSGIHGRLAYRHNQWWIEDLESTNGTFLNRQRIFNPVVLTNNDRIRLGDVELNVEIRNGQHKEAI